MSYVILLIPLLACMRSVTRVALYHSPVSSFSAELECFGRVVEAASDCASNMLPACARRTDRNIMRSFIIYAFAPFPGRLCSHHCLTSRGRIQGTGSIAEISDLDGYKVFQVPNSPEWKG